MLVSRHFIFYKNITGYEFTKSPSRYDANIFGGNKSKIIIVEVVFYSVTKFNFDFYLVLI